MFHTHYIWNSNLGSESHISSVTLWEILIWDLKDFCLLEFRIWCIWTHSIRCVDIIRSFFWANLQHIHHGPPPVVCEAPVHIRTVWVARPRCELVPVDSLHRCHGHGKHCTSGKPDLTLVLDYRHEWQFRHERQCPNRSCHLFHLWKHGSVFSVLHSVWPHGPLCWRDSITLFHLLSFKEILSLQKNLRDRGGWSLVGSWCEYYYMSICPMKD